MASARPAILQPFPEREMPEPSYTIAPVAEPELDDLLLLVRAYCRFYEVAPAERELRALMQGLLGARGREGVQLLARDPAGEAVGFATLLFTWSTVSAARVAVMEDLYVAPAVRGQGLGTALIDRCASEARGHGAAELSWITAPDNERAQAVYDRLADREQWVTYRVRLSGP